MKILTSIRKFAIKMKPYVNYTIGAYYGIIHLAIMFLGANILLFDTNLTHLFILFMIISVDALSCVILHNCPLTLLEQKYMGDSVIRKRMKMIKSLNISFRCNHEYESTLEGLTNLNAMVILKMFMVILYKNI